MKQGVFTVLENNPIAHNTYAIELGGDISGITAPGQFVNIAVPDYYLRRPISVCSARGDMLTLVYKVVGAGTAALASLPRGAELDLLTGLGNGFDINKSFKKPLLIGGGAGVAPLYGLAESLLALGIPVTAVLGFNMASEIFLAKELAQLGAEVRVATADGSIGVRGFVTDAAGDISDNDYIFACGPEPMLKAVYGLSDTDGQYSFEKRMACGFGACMGCSCKTKYGSKRICKDGPVLERDEIIW